MTIWYIRVLWWWVAVPESIAEWWPFATSTRWIPYLKPYRRE